MSDEERVGNLDPSNRLHGAIFYAYVAGSRSDKAQVAQAYSMVETFFAGASTLLKVLSEATRAQDMAGFKDHVISLGELMQMSGKTSLHLLDQEVTVAFVAVRSTIARALFDAERPQSAYDLSEHLANRFAEAQRNVDELAGVRTVTRAGKA